MMEAPREVSPEHRIPSLDGIRALSIAVVFAGHFSRFSEDSPIGRFLTPLPHTGVLVFFVISGYLITQLLIAEREKTGEISLRKFYLRRAFRILPAAYACIVIVMLFFGEVLSPAHKLSAFFFLQDFASGAQWNLGHLWSLAVEEQFYFLWPLVVVFAFRKRYSVLVAIIAVVPLINMYLVYTHSEYWGRAFYSVADSLAMGCLMALIRKRESVQRFVDNRCFLLILIPFAFVVLTNVMHFGFFLSVCKTLLFRPFINVAIALLIEYLVRHPPFLFNCSPVRWVGRLSYSLYLWQQPFCRMPGISLSAALAYTLLCAMASYYLIELPFLWLRKIVFARYFARPLLSPQTA